MTLDASAFLGWAWAAALPGRKRRPNGSCQCPQLLFAGIDIILLQHVMRSEQCVIGIQAILGVPEKITGGKNTAKHLI